MTLEREKYIAIIRGWWESFPSRSRSRGNITGGLVLLEHLRSDLNFDIEAHKASGSDQLRNASRVYVQGILARFGETRVLLQEGGRTNRGLMRNLTPLLSRLAESGIKDLEEEDRNAAIDAMQSFLADRATVIFNSDKISFTYDSTTSSREIIGKILDSARERYKGGDVAQYLVGAKLALRFPAHDIRNSVASAADVQTQELGDFQISDCIFHVTVAPNAGHYEKCKSNIANGMRVFVLVPDARLLGTRQVVEQELADRVSVESIESFVSQNIEELSEFASDKVATNLRLLLEKYNERVAEVETDLSLQITIPAALSR